MYLQDLINWIDRMKPNNRFTAQEKVEWVNEVETRVQQEAFLRPPEIVYDWETDKETVLLLSAPHDSIYKHHLRAQLSYANEEYDIYQNEMEMFNKCWSAFMLWVCTGARPAYEPDSNGSSSGGNGSSGNGGGADGFSPIIRISDIPGGHRVIITDAQGLKMFDVPDGYTPVKGVDYFTEEEIAEIEQSIAGKVQAGDGAVLYISQELNTAQKTQARTNIGAVGMTEVNAAINNAIGEVSASLSEMDEVIG